MSHLAIKVENLSKQYRIGSRHEPYRTFRDTLTKAVTSPFCKAWDLIRGIRSGAAGLSETIWALKDVSFDVKGGEVVGIIGRNGAGKTTLLRILSRITEPTRGQAEIYGRVGSLLEVGTGFHPELTGRENIYLNGAILGMRKTEIDRKFDEIVAFAEIEKFIDTPVKHYSSGMYVRLAFAVAAHLEPEILLVDEVLAVGDAAFQKKCLGKMGDVARGGRTVLFVSHNMGAITRLCPRSLLVDSGRLCLDGPSNQVVNEYQSEFIAACSQWRRKDEQVGDSDFAFLTVTVLDETKNPTSLFEGAQPIFVEIQYVVRQALSGCQIATRIYESDGIVAFTTTDVDGLGLSAVPKEPGLYRTQFKIPGGLLSPGRYHLVVASHVPRRCKYEVIEQAVVFEISPSGSLQAMDGRIGVVSPLIDWETQRTPLRA